MILFQEFKDIILKRVPELLQIAKGSQADPPAAREPSPAPEDPLSLSCTTNSSLC